MQLRIIDNEELNFSPIGLENEELDRFEEEKEEEGEEYLEYLDTDSNIEIMACKEEPRWSLRDLPSFGKEKNENQQSFLLSLTGFPNYINCNPEPDNTKFEQPIIYLENCLPHKSRDWFENHVATRGPRVHEGSTRNRLVDYSRIRPRLPILIGKHQNSGIRLVKDLFGILNQKQQKTSQIE